MVAEQSKPALFKEFQFYLEHQDEFVEQYEDKHLVIVGEELIDVYDTFEEAYEFAQSKYPLGKFLIKHCTPGSIGYTQHFSSRVTFA